MKESKCGTWPRPTLGGAYIIIVSLKTSKSESVIEN